MRRFRWTTALFIVGGISAILLYIVKENVRSFPEEVMYLFVLDNYIWQALYMQFVSVGMLYRLYIPPPLELAEFSVNMQLIILYQ